MLRSQSKSFFLSSHFQISPFVDFALWSDVGSSGKRVDSIIILLFYYHSIGLVSRKLPLISWAMGIGRSHSFLWNLIQNIRKVSSVPIRRQTLDERLFNAAGRLPLEFEWAEVITDIILRLEIRHSKCLSINIFRVDCKVYVASSLSVLLAPLRTTVHDKKQGAGKCDGYTEYSDG